MGISIEYMGERRSKAALRRAIWSMIYSKLPGEFDVDAAVDVVAELCSAIDTAIEDMKAVAEFKRIGFEKRHWYRLELSISDSSVSTQNVLERANTGALHPTNLLGRCVLRMRIMDLAVAVGMMLERPVFHNV